MIEGDTIKLLRECDAGIKMGVSAIDEVLDSVKNTELSDCLIDCKTQHEELKVEIQEQLDRYHDDGKNPNPMAKGMSWMKTNMKMGMDSSDQTIADLITDGCNMGVKSLRRYMNQYQAADSTSRDICGRLVSMEEDLCRDLQEYL